MTFGDDPEYEDGRAVKERIAQRERDAVVKETVEAQRSRTARGGR